MTGREELKPCKCGGKLYVDSFKRYEAVGIYCDGCDYEFMGYWSDSHNSITERYSRMEQEG